MATSTVEKTKGQAGSEKQDKVVREKNPNNKSKMNSGNLLEMK